MDPIQIIRSDETYVKKFRLYGKKTIFKFNLPPTGFNELEWVKNGFAQLVQDMKREATGPNDHLGFTLKSLSFKTKEPGYVAFSPAAQVDDDVLWNIFGSIIQSNEESLTSSDTFTVECTRVSLPVGSGGLKRSGFFNNFTEECRNRRGIITIKNDDNWCLVRALVVAKAHLKESKDVFKAIVKDKRKLQTLKAEKLLAKARVQIPTEGGSITELEKLQSHMKKYKITVYNYNTRGREIYFSGDNSEAKLKINLLFHEGHFNVITSLTAAFACQFYCEACHVPYEKKHRHKCSSMCPSCMVTSPPCIPERDGVTCPNCHRSFRNQTCFIAHQNGICSYIKKCLDCDRIIRPKDRKDVHVCGEQFCKVCLRYMQPNHKCYMRVDEGKPKSKNYVFIFFDLETRQDEQFRDDNDKKLHVVNLCVSQQYCWKCIKGDGTMTCENCVPRQKVFKQDPVAKFMDYVMEIRKKFGSVCVIAHNGQGFDFQFLLKYMYSDTKFSPKLISRGTKIILMEFDNVRFVDSINYFPMALAALPKAFDLGPEKKKGFFPHLFNTLDNQTYVGPMPDKIYYCPDSMFKKGHDTFVEWYNEQVTKNYTFDFQKEILEYCISDVDILAQACIKFRELFLKECNVDPFLEAVTIASACNLAFRRNFLKKNTIGIIPTGGYRLADNQSAKALQWMAWEEEKQMGRVHIQHAGNDREFKIPGVGKVDGFDGEKVYEFHGCYFHGCPKCFPYKREDHLQEDLSDSLHMRYERTKTRIEKLKELHYEVVEMWECEFNDLKKKNKLQYLNSLPILNTIPLNPRDAFFGGRTGNTKTYYKCKEGESIHYVDICSLYPWVCKYGKFPIGHPTIFVGDDECSKRGISVEGLLKCKILPPTNLYHPVLPIRMNNKLMFVLCRKCGETQSQENDCQHGVEEKALVGTWTMQEIRKAVERGYVILERYELWEYEMATFENGGLFTEFINKFLKIKQESSGYPSWCTTEEEKSIYIKDYFDKENILLDSTKIEKNEGLRSLGKLMLNSFWGKFGQRENQTKTLVTRDPKELFKLLVSPSDQVNRIKEAGEEVVIVNWQHLEEVGECLRTVNVVLAAFTTSQARLKLYEHLEKLDRQVCYYDTDSVIYVYRPGLYKIPVGDYLGDMTDELAKDYGEGSYITEFCSGGPKTYGYRVFSTNTGGFKEVCKIKGLTLNLTASKKLNFASLKEMVLREEDMSTPLEITESRIRRTEDRDVVTVVEQKHFRITGPKRKRDGENDTLPHGYKRRRNSQD